MSGQEEGGSDWEDAGRWLEPSAPGAVAALHSALAALGSGPLLLASVKGMQSVDTHLLMCPLFTCYSHLLRAQFPCSAPFRLSSPLFCLPIRLVRASAHESVVLGLD